MGWPWGWKKAGYSEPRAYWQNQIDWKQGKKIYKTKANAHAPLINATTLSKKKTPSNRQKKDEEKTAKGKERKRRGKSTKPKKRTRTASKSLG